MVEISFDPAKRAKTLAERGLDFTDARRVFAGPTASADDDRRDYGEVRHLTYGWLNGVAVALVWTERADTRRIISMRRMHDWEIADVGLD